jgi:hypothetical protein
MTPAMEFLNALQCPDVNIRFIHQNTQAIKDVKKNEYDLIIFGDRTNDGTVYDVALEVRDSRKNKHTAVVCVGTNTGKIAKIRKLLKPYALLGGSSHRTVTVTRINAYFESRREQSSSQE